MWNLLFVVKSLAKRSIIAYSNVVKKFAKNSVYSTFVVQYREKRSGFIARTQ